MAHYKTSNGSLLPSKLVLILSIVVPVVLFTASAYHSYDALFDRAINAAKRTHRQVLNQTLAIFHQQDIILTMLAQRFSHYNWEQIENDPMFHDDMVVVDRLTDNRVYAIAVADPTGKVRVSTLDAPSDRPLVVPKPNGGWTNINESEHFVAQQQADQGFFISKPRHGRFTGALLLTYSRRVPDANDPSRFNGIVFCTQPVDHMTDYWKSVLDHAVPDIDNAINAIVLRRGDEVVAQIGDANVASDPELTLTETIGDYPASLTLHVNHATIIAAWHREMLLNALVMIPAMMALVLTSWRAIRKARRVVTMRDQLIQTTEQLKAEMARREAAEETVRQAQKNEAIGQLTSGVAHDFNNFLTAIIGNLCLLQRRPDARSMQKFVEPALNAAGTAQQLTKQLLAYARKTPFNVESVEINAVILQNMNILKMPLSARFTITHSLDPRLRPCKLDAVQLKTALLNLVVNARDAMANGGNIHIATVAERNYDNHPHLPNGAYLTISVTDTGVGMTETVVGKAFDPYFTTKDVGKGNGLGLSQVYGFARQSGGHCEISSELGKGTTVLLYLPCRAGTADAPETSETTVEHRGVETILVVEDNKEVKELVETILSELGYHVISANHGIEAISILENTDQPIDLLFTDISMPMGMNGYEVATMARRLRPHIRVLYTTGNLGEQTPDDGGRIVEKPYRPLDLAREIRLGLRA